MRCAFTSQGSAAAPAPARAQGRGWAGLCESGTQRKGKGISVENSLQGYAPKQQKLTVLLLRRARTGWTWPGGRGGGASGGGRRLRVPGHRGGAEPPQVARLLRAPGKTALSDVTGDVRYELTCFGKRDVIASENYFINANKVSREVSSRLCGRHWPEALPRSWPPVL